MADFQDLPELPNENEAGSSNTNQSATIETKKQRKSVSFAPEVRGGTSHTANTPPTPSRTSDDTTTTTTKTNKTNVKKAPPPNAVRQAQKREIEARKKELRRRVEAEARHRVDSEERVADVQMSLLGHVDKQQLADAAKYLRPVDYGEVVEERALSKICGYPLCGRKLPEQKGGRYMVSLREHKVYDREVVGRFCGNGCHVASDFYASQLSEAALWLRTKKDQEIRIRLLKIGDDKKLVPEEVNPSEPSKQRTKESTPLASVTERFGDIVPPPSNVYNADPDLIDGFKVPQKRNFAPKIPKNEMEVSRKGKEVEGCGEGEGKEAGVEGGENRREGGSERKEVVGAKRKTEGGEGYQIDPTNRTDPNLLLAMMHMPKKAGTKSGSEKSKPKMTIFGTVWTAIDDWVTEDTKRFLQGKLDVGCGNVEGEGEVPESEGREEEEGLRLSEAVIPQAGMVTTATRRKILLQQLNSVVPTLLSSFGVRPNCVSQDLTMLVNTFDLGRRSLYFSLGVLSAICMLLLDALCSINPELKSGLHKDNSAQFLDRLGELGFDSDHLKVFRERFEEDDTDWHDIMQYHPSRFNM
eukprot:comp17639_c0_seq1/m.17393 comp17639_c0_seq1/g.17393  ORF comp17639_c0_seq1/g.17393 comp17639_c0_seq1/m.17393 type:complete len:582 (-) comp17639_c0_seq1:503-2248(-)